VATYDAVERVNSSFHPLDPLKGVFVSPLRRTTLKDVAHPPARRLLSPQTPESPL